MLLKFQYYQTTMPTFFTFSHQYSLKFSIQMNKTAYLNNFQYLQRIIKLYFLMAFLPFTHPLHCHCSSSNFLFPHLIPCIFDTLFPASAFFFLIYFSFFLIFSFKRYIYFAFCSLMRLYLFTLYWKVICHQLPLFKVSVSFPQ